MIETQFPPRTKSFAEVLAPVTSISVSGNLATLIRGIAIDSRKVVQGDLFVALRGGYFDGHQFVDQARARGASALLVEKDVNAGLPTAIVRNCRETLAIVAAQYFDHPSSELAVVGVTGTDGKTTTCHLIDAIFRANGLSTGMIGTVSVKLGQSTEVHEFRQTTPESLDVQRYLRHMVDLGVERATIEATSHGLALHRLDHVTFDIAAVTNITHEHLEYHVTIEAYRRAKGILFERVAAKLGTGIINLDDSGARKMLEYTKKGTVITFAIDDQSADVRANAIELNPDSTTFDFCADNWSRRLRLPLLGRFNVENALCAAAVGSAAGVPFSTICDALEQVSHVPGRMSPIDEGQPFSVIVDYAHTPESLTKVLALARSLCPRGRIIAVSGSAGERDIEKRRLQGAVCSRMADLSIFTSEDPRFEDPDNIIDQIATGAIAAGGCERRTFFRITDRRAAIRLALETALAGDLVLLAGKGHERSMIWGMEKRPWNEESVAREELRDLGYQLPR